MPFLGKFQSQCFLSFSQTASNFFSSDAKLSSDEVGEDKSFSRVGWFEVDRERICVT